jgi:hypothetical protein
MKICQEPREILQMLDEVKLICCGALSGRAIDHSGEDAHEWRRNFEPPFSSCLCRCVRVLLPCREAPKTPVPHIGRKVTASCTWTGVYIAGVVAASLEEQGEAHS